MTLYDRDDFAVRRSGGWRAVKFWTIAWFKAMRARRERRRAVLYMSEMPDWQLKDIGLNRGDVHRLLGRKISPESIRLDQRR